MKINSKTFYPVQMASIKSNDWRLRDYLKKTNLELGVIEHKLWLRIKNMALMAYPPPKFSNDIKNSQLIGFGWEWAVYVINNESNYVYKIPRGIFPEVNNRQYLKNSEYAYRVCSKYLKDFVVPSEFNGIESDGRRINVIKQERITGDFVDSLRINRIDSDTRTQLITLAGQLMVLLEKIRWIPDMNLQNGLNNGWRLTNLVRDADDNLKILDYTYYYDPFRLYPARCKEEVKNKGNLWKKFLKELKK